MTVLIARVESTSLQPDSTRGDDQGPVVNPRNFSCRQWRGRLFSWAALFFLRTTRKPAIGFGLRGNEWHSPLLSPITRNTFRHLRRAPWLPVWIVGAERYR